MKANRWVFQLKQSSIIHIGRSIYLHIFLLECRLKSSIFGDPTISHRLLQIISSWRFKNYIIYDHIFIQISWRNLLSVWTTPKTNILLANTVQKYFRIKVFYNSKVSKPLQWKFLDLRFLQMAFGSSTSHGSCVWTKTEQLEIVCWPINPEMVRSFWLLWPAISDQFPYQIAWSDSFQSCQILFKLIRTTNVT